MPQDRAIDRIGLRKVTVSSRREPNPCEYGRLMLVQTAHDDAAIVKGDDVRPEAKLARPF